MSASFSRTSYVVKEIIAGDFPLVTRPGVLAAGQNLTRGAVLGRVTATGKLVLSVAAATDGSGTPFAILADEEADASAADVGVTSYLTGQFLARNLTFGAGHTADSTRDALRLLSIHI
ncbi:head decoration protein [Allorhizobium borbori]|uniref:Bacteriophage lambda head decoration protein D n=1 Tax=Allorhizobium borbori TaxID=485907 RepID=A0A7W6K1B9_9HYPH|nr:head decoration protein [Allorhizobium borbori]MBB4102391.1 hypothetical protein [Allorhizobium borbori]